MLYYFACIDERVTLFKEGYDLAGKRAIVLSGGGAKGAYQIGAWKALREIGFVPDIVTGTSVGAANGALIAMDAYDSALELWQDICMEEVFAQFQEEVLAQDSRKNDAYIRRLAKEALFRGGADCTPLHNKLRELIDEERLRNSGVDYGLVITTFPTKKLVEVFLSDIPPGKLMDYIVASAAAFPLVRAHRIGDTKYVDGGFTDNMPVQMAINRGAQEVVAINIGTMSLQKLKPGNAKIHYIHNKRPFNEGQRGALVRFDKELSARNMRQGYLDTCKAFGMYDGSYYTFEKFERYRTGAYEGVCAEKFDSIFSGLPNVSRFEKMGRQSLIDLVRTYEDRPFEHNANVLYCAEIAAELFGLDPREVYTIDGMSAQLVSEVTVLLSEDTANTLAHLTRQLDKGLSLDLFKSILKNWDKKLLVGFCLQLLLEDTLEYTQRRRLWLVAALMPEIVCAALFCSAAILLAS